MKITLLTIIVVFSALAPTYSQKINLSLTNASLEKTFKEIRKQTGYSFVYTRDQINKSNPVSINVKDASLKQVLEICFNDQPLSFTIDNKYIIIAAKSKDANSLANSLERNISGKVIDENDAPIIGATVTDKNSSVAVATDDNGEFAISTLKEITVLLVSSIGYTSAEMPIGAKSHIIIRLRTAAGLLDETVIIAYGQTTKRLNTGSVGKVSAAEINRQPVANPLAAIQGRVPGVFVNTENGLPGGNISVQIRGKGSINSGTDPLYVVDGVPFTSIPLNTTFSSLSDGIGGKTSPLNSINPGDIESIEILKDADATAIYGSRAANGVILITTKKGASGKTKFNFNVNTGVSRLADFPDLLNLTEYLEIRREGYKNDGITPSMSDAPDLLLWDTTKSTNWPKYILGGTALNANAQASISGGNEFTNFLLSGNFRKESIILPGDSKYQRGGIHLTLEHTSREKNFSVNFSSSYTLDNNQLISSSIFGILTLPPNVPIYDTVGNYNWQGVSGLNPKAVLLQKSKSITNNLLSNLVLRYDISPDLKIKTSFGYMRIEMDQVMLYPTLSLDPNFGSAGYAFYGNNRNETIIIEPQLEYLKKIKRSSIRILLGSSWQYSIQQGSFIYGTNYSNDALLESQGAAGYISSTNLYTVYKYASIFGRFHYDLNGRYLFNVSMRRDGSSRFGPGRQFGNFGSTGAGWIFSKEPFLEKFKFLSYGKIRASYGITGNDLINDYQYLTTYGTSGNNYQGVNGLSPVRIANADFGWESNKKLETAIELGIIKDKILFTVAWYKNRSGNQLIDYPLPYTSGPFGHYLANLPAEVENKGWEFEINASVINNDKISWSLSGNISLPKNKLLKYPGLELSSFANTYVIGEDLNIKKAFNFVGINKQTGIPEYEDINHDGFITAPEDYTIIGNTSPLFYGGFGSEFKYRRLQLNIFFQYSKQYAQGLPSLPGLQSNFYNFALTRWQKQGDITSVPRSTTTPGAAYFNLLQSDAVFYNGSYIRLKNLSLSFNLPTRLLSKLKISSCKIYIEGQNLLTWKKSTGLYDPETAFLGVPPLKSFVGGIQLTF